MPPRGYGPTLDGASTFALMKRKHKGHTHE